MAGVAATLSDRYTNLMRKRLIFPIYVLLTLLAWPLLPLAPVHAQDKAGVPKWETLKAAYNYDKNPQGKPLAVDEKPDDDRAFNGVPLTTSHLSFQNGQGHTVTGMFLRPKADLIEGKAYPVVLLLHDMGSDKETVLQAYGRYFGSKGFACIALDAQKHGERREPGQDRAIAGAAFFEMMRETVLDYRLALDWVESRKDLDKNRVGVFGFGLGAMMTTILGSVDERIKAETLCCGGDPVISSLDGLPSQIREAGLTASPSLYIAHFAPRPVLMVNAKDDRVMLRPFAERLQEAAKKPMEIKWISGGHGLLPNEARDAMNWLIEKLTPATSPAV